MNPAVVIPAFSRPAALERLLNAAADADVAAGTPLLLSIDAPSHERYRAGNTAVIELARRFPWPHGPKEVVVHRAPLGLVGNVFFCGAAAETYGAVVLLEDDLLVSSRFHAYARQALAAYGGEARLAGISLNAPWFNGFTHQPFIPLLDDGDVFFLQLSTPHGQVYTAEQWQDFTQWLAMSGAEVGADRIHPLLAALPVDDWLGTKGRYLVDTGRYYVYPRESLTTAVGEPGTHFSRATTFFHVPLQHRRRDFRFIPLDDAAAVHDSFYELLPARLNRLTNRFAGLEYDVDLNATKPPHILRAEHILTTRRCRRAVMTFGRSLRPLEANVIDGAPGEGISLARREDVDTSERATRAAQAANEAYFARRRKRRLAIGRLRD